MSNRTSFAHSIVLKFRDLGAVAGYQRLNRQLSAYKKSRGFVGKSIGRISKAGIALGAAAVGIGSVASAGAGIKRMGNDFVEAAKAMNALEVRSKGTKEQVAELVGLSAKLAGQTIFSQPEIMEAIAKNDVVILCGPTGYGAKLASYLASCLLYMYCFH